MFLRSVNILNLDSIGDERGKLIALEQLSEQVPFLVKRLYFIFDTTPGTVRGKHAHKILKQLLVCVSGSCTIVCDNGTESTEYHLDRPDKGLIIEGLIWREMKDFSKGAVLVVLASEHYHEDDYVRSYDDFRQLVSVAGECSV